MAFGGEGCDDNHRQRAAVQGSRIDVEHIPEHRGC